jgi:hypothetical protein
MKIMLAVAGALVLLFLGTLGWMGGLTGVQVQEQEKGPYSFVYVQEASTDFARVGELTEALGQRLDAAGFRQRQPAQIFYPAGRGVQHQVGFVVDRSVPYEVLGNDTFFRPLPAQRFMVARFPYRNRLSFVLGAWRSDAALRAHREQRGYGDNQVMVILEGNAIVYLQPIAPGA